jgi:hypothetical protein
MISDKDFERLEIKINAIGEALRSISRDQQVIHNTNNRNPYSAEVLYTVFGEWEIPKQ